MLSCGMGGMGGGGGEGRYIQGIDSNYQIMRPQRRL